MASTVSRVTPGQHPTASGLLRPLSGTDRSGDYWGRCRPWSVCGRGRWQVDVLSRSPTINVADASSR